MTPAVRGPSLKSEVSPVGLRAAWVVALLPCLFLFYTSLADMPSWLALFDVKRLLEVGMFPLVLLTTLLQSELRRAYTQLVDGLPPAARYLLLLLFGLGVVASLRVPRPNSSSNR